MNWREISALGAALLFLLSGSIALGTVAGDTGATATSDHTSFSSAKVVTDGAYSGESVPGDGALYYAVELNASEQVTFSTSGASENLEMTLFAPDQVTKLRTQNPRFDPNVALTYTANQEATFYLRVDSKSDRSTNYTLSVSTPDLTDSLEPNNEIGAATLVSDGQYTDLHVAGSELDYYAVELNASEQVTFSTSGASENLEMTLFAPDRVTKLRTQNPRFDPNVELTYTANQEATFYLWVDSKSDRSTEYTLQVNKEDLTDSLEPNDDVANARLLGAGRYRDLYVAGAEFDVYAVPLNASEELTIRATDATQSLQAKLYAPDGTTELLSKSERFDDDVEFSYTVDQDGVYSVELNSENNRSTGYRLVVNSNQTITLPNVRPEADAGTDTTVDAGATVTLDASGSSDVNRDSLTYTWTQTGGPSVSLSDSGAETPEFSAPDVSSETTLTFEVAVSDGQTSDTDTVSVTVEPQSGGGQHESGVSQRVFDAIADSDGQLGRQDVLQMVSAYARGQAVGGVTVSRTQVLLLVSYYVTS